MAGRKEEARWAIHAAAGDRNSLELLLDSVQRPLYCHILGIVQRHGLAEDILQDVLFRIYRKLKWLREPLLFRPWAFRIASRECFRKLKRERRRHEQIEDFDKEEAVACETELEWHSIGSAESLMQLIMDLSPASRSVIMLHYIEEMTIEEVSDALGISIGTAKSRLAYGLGVLRRRIPRTGKAAENAAGKKNG